MADQRTDEWWAARRGKVTASRIKAVMANGRGGEPSKTRATYMVELIAERCTDSTEESYTSAAMQAGVDMEPQAKAHYQFTYGVEIEEVGFVEHPTIPMSGASPDGVIRAWNAGVELKCVIPTTQVKTLLKGTGVTQYRDQMQWQMACLGPECKMVKFISFSPKFKDGMACWTKTVDRDNERIAELEDGVVAFLKEIDDKMASLEEAYG